MAKSSLKSDNSHEYVKKRVGSLCFYPCFSRIDHGT